MPAAADQLKPAEREDVWPALPLEEWQDTYATLHMWTQVAGKVRLFWPGSGDVKGPAFYSYTVPEPPGYAEHKVRPDQAYYHSGIREFVLMYDDVRNADSPKDALLEFLQSTYEAGAILGHWDRASLEAPVDRT